MFVLYIVCLLQAAAAIAAQKAIARRRKKAAQLVGDSRKFKRIMRKVCLPASKTEPDPDPVCMCRLMRSREFDKLKRQI